MKYTILILFFISIMTIVNAQGTVEFVYDENWNVIETIVKSSNADLVKKIDVETSKPDTVVLRTPKGYAVEWIGYESTSFLEIETFGTYKAVLSKNNCSDTVEYKVESADMKKTVIHETACGQYNFFGDLLTESGVFEKRLIANNGSDSIIYLHLEILPVYHESIEETLEYGEELHFGANIYSESGVYTETFHSISGCDSIVTLDLTVLDKEAIVEERIVAVCKNYNFEGQLLTESGKYSVNLKTKEGLDSVVLLDLTIYEEYTISEEKTITEGSSYLFGEQIITQGGKYTETFASIYGCDSIVTMTVYTKGAEDDQVLNAGDNLMVKITENPENGTFIAELPAVDKNGNLLQYTLSDNKMFGIDDGVVIVKDSSFFNAEENERIALIVYIDDSVSESIATLTLDIENINEPPVLHIEEIELSNKAKVGTLIAELPLFDEDGDKLQYTLFDSNGAFDIINDKIVLSDQTKLPSINTKISVLVTVSDGHHSINETIHISVIVENKVNINEEMTEIKITPTVVDDIVTIKAKGITGSLSIVSVLGFTVYSVSFNDEQQLNLSFLPPGSYFVCLNDNSKKMNAGIILKRE